MADRARAQLPKSHAKKPQSAKPQSQRPQRRSSSGSQAGPPTEDPDGAQLDPADIFAGVALLIAIPTLTYVILGMVGMPVSGQSGTAQDSMATRELLQERRTPITEVELKERMEHLLRLLNDRVSHWSERAAKETEPVEVHRFLKYALTTIGHLEGELGVMRADLKGNPDLNRYEQQIHSTLVKTRQLKTDLVKREPFVNIRKAYEKSIELGTSLPNLKPEGKPDGSSAPAGQ